MTNKKDLSPEMLVLVNAVREKAEASYNESYGWSEIVECYTEHEIAEELEKEEITTVEKALELFAFIAEVRSEYAAEIESTAW